MTIIEGEGAAWKSPDCHQVCPLSEMRCATGAGFQLPGRHVCLDLRATILSGASANAIVLEGYDGCS